MPGKSTQRRRQRTDNPSNPSDITYRMKIKLIITRRREDIHCALDQHPQFWDCGPTVDAAVGAWIRTHGADFGVELSFPEASFTLTDPKQGVLNEDELLLFATGRSGRAMSIHEREWCLQEIDRVEGFDRKNYEQSDNKRLARGVLSAWVDTSSVAHPNHLG